MREGNLLGVNYGEAELALRLFGPFELTIRGQPVAIQRSKVKWLLALLILWPEKLLEREWVQEQLWPDADLERGRGHLKSHLHLLRKALGAEKTRLSASRTTLGFDVSGAWVDALAFDTLTNKGDRASLEQGVALYCGPLLMSCNQDWLLPLQQAYERECLEALEKLAAQCRTVGETQESVRFLRRTVTLDPLRESAQLALIQALIDVKDISSAFSAFTDFQRAYRQEMDSDLDTSTRERFRQALTERRPVPVALPVSILPSREVRQRLPQSQTPFIGRAAELSAILGRLASVRLLTLVGMGGIGKTRLALAAAECMDASFDDGIVFVDIAPLTEDAQVAPALAAALRLSPVPELSCEEQIVGYLHQRRLLLVLDNCENLAAACGQLLQTLLPACPDLKAITTSRQALDLPEEATWPVPPLNVPAVGETPAPQALMAYEAVQLFVNSAACARPGFALTAANAPAVAKFCRRLEGIPLALKLAATWISIETPAQGLLRFARGLDTQAQPLSRLDARHFSLRAVVQSTFCLLPPRLQQFFMGLSVFRGGWTLATAQAVLEEPEALLLLAHLQERALIYSEESGEEMRLTMLESLREFAGEYLDTPEREDLCRRHAVYFSAWAEQGKIGLRSADHAVRISRLEAELPNLRAALYWLTEKPEYVREGLRLATVLSDVCYVRGYYQEGKDLLERALRNPVPKEDLVERAHALQNLQHLENKLGDYNAALVRAEEFLAVYEAIGDKRGATDARNNIAILYIERGKFDEAACLQRQCQEEYAAQGDRAGVARCLNNFGAIAFYHDDLITAKRQYQEALILQKEIGDQEEIADTVTNLGNVAWMQGDLPQARGRYEEALELYRALGLERGIVTSLSNLGAVAAARDDYVQANAFYEEGLQMARSAGEKRAQAILLINLAEVFCKLNDFGAARVHLKESLALCIHMGHKPYTIECLDGLAWVNQGEGRLQEAATLYAAAERLRRQFGMALSEEDNLRRRARIEAVRSAMGQEKFEARQAEGRAITMEQAVAFSI